MLSLLRPWLVLVVLSLLAASCSDDGSDTTPADPEPTEPTEPDNPGISDADALDPSDAVDADEVTGADAESVGPLAWESCGGGLECATLAVPLDHAEPDGQQIELAVARLPASGQREGSLVINPGGPGGSGVAFVTDAGFLFSEVSDRFDIVGFDPRGVGQSTPIDCLSDAELDDYLAVDLSPDDQAEQEAVIDAARDLAEGCAERSGELLAHVGTDAVVEDLELIRQALGDEQLTYLGFSYGSSIGQRYLARYPERVRAMVLDGLVDLARDDRTLTIDQARGFEATLTRFLESCDTEGCPFGQGNAAAAMEAILASLESQPLTVDGRELGPGLAQLGILYAAYSESFWPFLADALAAAEGGDGSGLMLLADAFTERQGGRFVSNGWEALFAVNCLDGQSAEVDEVQQLAVEMEGILFGDTSAWFSAPCAVWPLPGNDLGAPVYDTDQVPPVVLVSTTGDPATPHEWGLAVAEQIPGSVLVTHEGNSHTAYGDDACVTDYANRYLLDPGVELAPITC